MKIMRKIGMLGYGSSDSSVHVASRALSHLLEVVHKCRYVSNLFSRSLSGSDSLPRGFGLFKDLFVYVGAAIPSTMFEYARRQSWTVCM